MTSTGIRAHLASLWHWVGARVTRHHLDRLFAVAVAVATIWTAVPLAQDPAAHARTWTFAELDERINLDVVGWGLLGLAAWLAVSAAARPMARLAPAVLLGLSYVWISSTINEGVGSVGAPPSTVGGFGGYALLCAVLAVGCFLPEEDTRDQ